MLYMRTLTIPDARTVILGLQDEIRRSQNARYDHRLHAILLVAEGFSARQVAQMMGDSPRTVAYWVNNFLEEGVAGLTELERPGRPPRLSEEQVDEIEDALRMSPSACGLAGNLWDGKTLSAFIMHRWGITLGVRQCQRLFRQLGFRLRKPRPEIANADPALQAVVKKTQENGPK
jgi:transposase